MNKLRVIIADDERPAREFLKAVLREFGNVEIVGEADPHLPFTFEIDAPLAAFLDRVTAEAGRVMISPSSSAVVYMPTKQSSAAISRRLVMTVAPRPSTALAVITA